MKTFTRFLILTYTFTLGPMLVGQWSPPAPEPDEFDWIQLNSGEWLKGEIRTMYDETMDFDSDELGDLSLDFGDIKVIRTGGVQMVNVDAKEKSSRRAFGRLVPQGSGEVVTGYVRMDGDEFKIIPEAGGGETVVDRADIISLAAGEPREINFWDAKATLGANYRSGNTEQRDINTQIRIRRRTSSSQFYFQYLGNFSEAQGIETANNHRVTTYYDWFLNQTFFWRVAQLEAFQDPFQNIAQRYTIGTGFGWHIMDTSKFTWDATGGPAYQYLEFDSVTPPNEQTQSNPAASLSTNFDYEVSGKVDLIGVYSLIYAGDDAGGYNFIAQTTLETELLSWLDFDISYIWDYRSDPIPDSSGAVPEKSDSQLIFSLGMDL